MARIALSLKKNTGTDFKMEKIYDWSQFKNTV